jgi:pantoate--beta-alanine ligase
MAIEIISTVRQMHRYADAVRAAGKRIALVPTMGFLHRGHVSLMDLAREHADVLIVSVFVNPMQFGPGEDYASYPRDWNRDAQMISDASAECIFAPEPGEMYPEGFQTTVSVDGLSRNLCGQARPTHFSGVATVVAKLFACTKPHCAVFGQKDFQQLAVIRRMVADLNVDVDIIAAPIVREPDGIAMSSRNTYLSAEERTAACGISRALGEVRKLFDAGERTADTLVCVARDIVSADRQARIEYIKICDAETLQDCPEITRPVVMAVAVHYGKARLIDNIILAP